MRTSQYISTHNTDKPWCVICIWEGESVHATHEGIAPNKSVHQLCERHKEMYKEKYRGIVTIEVAAKLNTWREITVRRNKQ